MSYPFFYFTLVPEVTFDELLPYFDLTGIRGVMELPREEESNSGPILIPGSLLYGDKLRSTVYVSVPSTFLQGLTSLVPVT